MRRRTPLEFLVGAVFKSKTILLVEKGFYDGGNPINLGIGEFGIDGQAEAFAGGFFGDWEIAGAIAEVGVAFLQVQREGIMQGAADAVGIEVGF